MSPTTASATEDRAGSPAGQARSEAETVLAERAECDSRPLVVQCAWCARYLLGGQLLEAETLPCHLGVDRLWRERRVTHGVCDDCIDRVAAAYVGSCGIP